MESLSIIGEGRRKKHHRPPRIQKRKGKHYIHDTVYVKKEDLPKVIKKLVSNMKRKPLGSKFSDEDNLSIQNKILLGIYKQLDRNMLGSNYSSYESVGFKNHEGILNEGNHTTQNNIREYIDKVNEIKTRGTKGRIKGSKNKPRQFTRIAEARALPPVPQQPLPQEPLYSNDEEKKEIQPPPNTPTGYETPDISVVDDDVQDGHGIGMLAVPSIIKRIKEAVFFPAKELSKPFIAFMNKYGEYKILSAKIRRQPIGFVIDKVLNLISLGNFASAKKQLNYPDLFHLGILLKLELDDKNKEVVLEKLERPHFSESWSDDKQVEYLTVSVPKITLNEFVQNTIKKIGIHNFTQYGGFRGINCQNFIMDLLNANNSLTAEAKKFIYQPIEELIKKQPFWVDKIAQGVTDLSAKFKEFFGMGHHISSLPNGMDNRQIDKVFRSEPRYIGTLSRDGIRNASSLIHHAIDQYGECCFIMNLDKHNQDMYEHWVAFYIDVDKTKTIYYYDPFGEALPFKECLTDLHHIMNQLNIPYYLTFKQNNKKNQRINSNRCGIHCIVFLYKMLDGEDFYKATDSNEQEAIQEQKVLEGHGYI
jgi:hypothetical protein